MVLPGADHGPDCVLHSVRCAAVHSRAVLRLRLDRVATTTLFRRITPINYDDPLIPSSHSQPFSCCHCLLRTVITGFRCKFLARILAH